MFNLEEEQRILAASSDCNSPKSKEDVRINYIHVSAATIDIMNKHLEKACEVHDKLKIKSFHEASKHYSK